MALMARKFSKTYLAIDTPGAPEIARRVRNALESAGVTVESYVKE